MSRPIRAIHIVPSIAEEASGPSYSVVRLCESLIARGAEITLATLDWPSPKSPPAFLRAFPMGIGPRRLGRSPAMQRWLMQQSRAVDLFHNHSLWMMPNVYPGLVGRRTGTRTIVSPRGTLSAWAMRRSSGLKRLFWPLLQGPALAAATCFHATSEEEYEDVRRVGFHQPVAIIPNGVDIPDVTPKPLRDTRTLLFLGRIHPTKGVDVLLRAWGAVQHRFPDWHLRIVGPGAAGYLETMRALADELRLDRIEFSGPLGGYDKWRAYRDADLFVLPTHSESFGMAVAESLAAGTPVVVTMGAPWAGLRSHRAGWWIEIGLDSLVACFEEALSQSPDSLVQMGRRGRSWMEASYSWPQVGRQMTETYEWLIHGTAKPDCVIEA